jgi:chitosanase
MDTFRDLISQEKWDLALPIAVRGVLLNEEVLAGPPVRASAEDKTDRVLLLQSPPMRGDDVKLLQRALNNAGESLTVDGVYGPMTESTVRKFQRANRLLIDGAAGPATRAMLGI